MEITSQKRAQDKDVFLMMAQASWVESLNAARLAHSILAKHEGEI